MKNIKWIVIILFLIISTLHGCNNVDKKVDNVNKNDGKPVVTEQIIKPTDAGKDNQTMHLTLNSPNEIDLLPLYLEGLKNSDPNIRWYSCYKMIDYYNNIEKRNGIIESLKVLRDDSNISIKNASKFVLSIFEKSFNGEDFSKSPNGQYIAFYSFKDTRYNDGIPYVYYVEKDCIFGFESFTSINGFGWSPDGNILCISHGGRTWSNISLINLKSNKTYRPDVYNYICEKQKKLGYVTGKWARPDPVIGFIEWSPDMKKALLSYYFIDDNRVGQKGICVYNLSQEKVEKIVKLGEYEEDHPSIEKPGDFKW